VPEHEVTRPDLTAESVQGVDSEPSPTERGDVDAAGVVRGNESTYRGLKTAERELPIQIEREHLGAPPNSRRDDVEDPFRHAA